MDPMGFIIISPRLFGLYEASCWAMFASGVYMGPSSVRSCRPSRSDAKRLEYLGRSSQTLQTKAFFSLKMDVFIFETEA